MKTLLIIRHAKSDQSFFGNDFERPLNERGKKNAPEMAKRLADKNIAIDAFVASPAKRTKKTAEIFCETYKQDVEDIIFISALYHAPAREFYDVINGLDDSFNNVAIFAHNPGISYFVNDLVKDVRIDNMPTCAVYALQIDIDQWKDFAKGKKNFYFLNILKATEL
ncbi:MAG: histidine phosphatase family protein [Ferruginibacter sp.]